MSEYYGITPSSDFFMHYGVFGMKWGVRKARAVTNLDRNGKKGKTYKSAEEKLKSNIRKGIARSAITSGLGSAGLTYGINRLHGVPRVQSAITAGIAGLTGAAAGATIAAGQGHDLKRQFKNQKAKRSTDIKTGNPSYDRLSRKQKTDLNKAMKNWADAFEKHYQTGLSRGMSHEQAERYSNNYIAKHGFKPVNKRTRRG